MCVVFVASCSKDDSDFIPSYQSDLICVLTNTDSLVTDLVLDNGQKLKVSSQHIKAPFPNARIRCYSSFEIVAAQQEAKVYDIKAVSCFIPAPADSFKVHPMEPINLTSIWKSGGFINLCLAPLVNGSQQTVFDFCIDSISTQPDSSRIMHTSLLFTRTKESIEGYTTKIYHSIPLEHPDYSSPFDSMYIYINTYEGLKVYRFEK